MLPRTPLIGREAELQALIELAREAAAGAARVALVTGEPGIGKSRLVRELVHVLNEQGGLGVVSTSYEDTDEPFGPILRALRTLSKNPQGAAEAPLRSALKMLGRPSAASPVRRDGLYEAVANALTAAANGGPTAIAFEDVHWADPSTVEFLLGLARRLGSGVLMIATMRHSGDRDDTYRLTDGLRREFLGVRIELPPLGSADALAVVMSAARGSLDMEQAANLAARCDGNPFLLEEIARDAKAGATTSSVPRVVRDVVQHRLARLSQETRDVAAACAVLGNASSLERVAALLDRSQTDAGAAVDELIADEFLLLEGDQVRFRHSLAREAVHSSIPISRRNAMHLDAARLLEGNDRSDPAAIAAHLLASGATTARAQAIDYLLEATDRALALRAYEAASRSASQASAIIDGQGSPAKQRLRVLLLMGEVSRLSSSHAESLSTFERAAKLAVEVGDWSAEATAALGFEAAFLATARPRSDPDARSIALLEAALSHSPATVADQALLARTLAACAQAHFFAGHVEEARDLSARALSAAQSAGGRPAMPAALETRRMIIWGPDDPDERVAITDAIITEAVAVADEERILDGLYWQVMVLLEVGNLATVLRRLDQFAGVAQRLGLKRRMAELQRMRAMVALLRGDVKEACLLADDALKMAERAGDVDGPVFHAAFMLEAGRDTVEDTTLIRELVADPVRHATASRRALFSAFFVRAGELAQAASVIEGFDQRDYADLPRDWHWLPLMAILAEAIAQLARPEWAATAYWLLTPYADRYAVNSNAVCYGSMQYTLGLLAAACGMRTAEDHFRRSIARNEAVGARLWVARSREQLGLLLRERGKLAAATRELTAAGDAYGYLGLDANELRLRPLSASPVTDADGTGPVRLTPREREVLRLLASGQSNQQIADALVLSVRTVERHIENLYVKIGAHGRAEATAFALRSHLAV